MDPKNKVRIARVMLGIILIVGSVLSITQSLWWIPISWFSAGITACLITFGFKQMIATFIVGLFCGPITLIIIARDK